MKQKIYRWLVARFHSDDIANILETVNIILRNKICDRITLEMFANYCRKRQSFVVFEASQYFEQELERSDDFKTFFLPETVRKEMECHIESVTDSVAVVHNIARSLQSPMPSAAVEPLDEEAREYLNGKSLGYREGSPKTRFGHECSTQDMVSYLNGRETGVTLLAEALSREHPSGKLQSIMQLFELAFATKASEVCKRFLPNFLPTQLGFTTNECLLWLELRDTSSHADRRDFSLQSHTRPIVERLELAAYDVLLNKKQWKTPTLDRRDAFTPTYGAFGASGDMFLTKGKKATPNFILIDGFLAYPLDLRTQLSGLSPEILLAPPPRYVGGLAVLAPGAGT